MCTREEVRIEIDKALSNNNQIRNMNLENQLNKLSEKILDNIKQTAPDTTKAIEGIKTECAARGTSIALSNQKMADIEKKVDKVYYRMDEFDKKQDENFEKIMKELKDNYAPIQAWTIMKWAGGIFGAIVMGAIARLIIK